MAVMINTSLGDFVIDLHTDLCPLTCKNFLKLCKIKYYNNCLFHLVQKDFIMQTGDPTGTGSGGDSIYKFLYGEQARFFQDEIYPNLRHDKVGTVAMASAGENLNASQFYITARPGIDYLDGKHTIFGEIAEGIETIMRINEAYVDDKDRPFKNIRVKHTYILDDPFEDPPQLTELIPASSPELKPLEEGEEVRLEDDWVPMDEKVDPEELEKSLRRKEAHSRAVVLEMIGDVPDAEMTPPENVLFICKLNPVTQEEDLEIIFSRFGKVLSADIIRDYKTGDSLCYGFIEFENQEACEAAYFKMDNVLIDDRRIHVDFSQSVAKLWTRFRRFGTKDEGKQENETSHLKTSARPSYKLKDVGGQHGGSERRYDLLLGEDEIDEPSRMRASNKAGHHTEHKIVAPQNRSYEDQQTHRGRGLSSRSEAHDSHSTYRSTDSERYENWKDKGQSRDSQDYSRDAATDKRTRDRTSTPYHELDEHKRKDYNDNRVFEKRLRDRKTAEKYESDEHNGSRRKYLDEDGYQKDHDDGKHMDKRARDRVTSKSHDPDKMKRPKRDHGDDKGYNVSREQDGSEPQDKRSRYRISTDTRESDGQKRPRDNQGDEYSHSRDHDDDLRADDRAKDSKTVKTYTYDERKRAGRDQRDDEDHFSRKDHQSKVKHKTHDSHDDVSQRYTGSHHHKTRR